MTNRLEQLPEDLQRNIYEERIAQLNQELERMREESVVDRILMLKQRTLIMLLKKDFKRWAGFEWHANIWSDEFDAKIINRRDIPGEEEPTSEDGRFVDPYPQEIIELRNKVYPFGPLPLEERARYRLVHRNRSPRTRSPGRGRRDNRTQTTLQAKNKTGVKF